MKIEVITPEKTLFEGEIEIIKLPGTNGSFEIMKNHAPLISTLTEGKLRLKEPDGNLLVFEITGGVVEVSENNIKVLVEV